MSTPTKAQADNSIEIPLVAFFSLSSINAVQFFDFTSIVSLFCIFSMINSLRRLKCKTKKCTYRSRRTKRQTPIVAKLIQYNKHYCIYTDGICTFSNSWHKYKRVQHIIVLIMLVCYKNSLAYILYHGSIYFASFFLIQKNGCKNFYSHFLL